ncbi:hypothetical protein N657DRAFT_647043 [Parathielavia appendiculata]|uniref:Uncharacterized protein n=1 Tax=Parathielavia appendiculata TaxID=2587402 RepID=A0AAN6TX47_9PEZI|nr:hypothetical protein N657DRAFT_647043 [Parathielavia appendiculata]
MPVPSPSPGSLPPSKSGIPPKIPPSPQRPSNLQQVITSSPIPNWPVTSSHYLGFLGGRRIRLGEGLAFLLAGLELLVDEQEDEEGGDNEDDAEDDHGTDVFAGPVAALGDLRKGVASDDREADGGHFDCGVGIRCTKKAVMLASDNLREQLMAPIWTVKTSHFRTTTVSPCEPMCFQIVEGNDRLSSG